MVKYGHVIFDAKLHEAVIKTVQDNNLGSQVAYIKKLLMGDPKFLKSCKSLGIDI